MNIPRTKMVPISTPPTKIFSQHVVTWFHQVLSSKTSLLSFSHLYLSYLYTHPSNSLYLQHYRESDHFLLLSKLSVSKSNSPQMLVSISISLKVGYKDSWAPCTYRVLTSESLWGWKDPGDWCWCCSRNYPWERLPHTKSLLHLAWTISYTPLWFSFFSPCSPGVFLQEVA